MPGKVFSEVLQKRMKSCMESALAGEQAGFKPGRGTTDQIFIIRQITEKYIEHHWPCYFKVSTSNRPLAASGRKDFRSV